ncbi:unnamed protein product [Soboliphyme baturini]|uniref:Enoyl-CoA hydratase n=1 Tax=Soboliphyme baturini TaxID=241478 RepID=A0A183J0Y3_9BILA|nr:unnamed protein product [Soboliphyme baturini]
MDAVCLIGINRPEKRNAIDYETSRLLLKAFEAFHKDDSLHVAVLYGKGSLQKLAITRSKLKSLKTTSKILGLAVQIDFWHEGNRASL